MRGERVGEKVQGRLGRDERREKSIDRQGSGDCCFGSLVVATRRCVSAVILEMMMINDRRTYPLPSSLASREKMVAKENMIAEENIVAEVGIDAEIRIIVAGVESCLSFRCMSNRVEALIL